MLYCFEKFWVLLDAQNNLTEAGSILLPNWLCFQLPSIFYSVYVGCITLAQSRRVLCMYCIRTIGYSAKTQANIAGHLPFSPADQVHGASHKWRCIKTFNFTSYLCVLKWVLCQHFTKFQPLMNSLIVQQSEGKFLPDLRIKCIPA